MNSLYEFGLVMDTPPTLMVLSCCHLCKLDNRSEIVHRTKVICWLSALLVLVACTQQPIGRVDVPNWEERERAAYANLSKREKEFVDNGTLVFNGTVFYRPPSMLARYRVGNNFERLVAQDPFECPLEDISDDNDYDHGTFLVYATKPGTPDVRVNYASMSLSLPTAAENFDLASGEWPYVMFAGWPPGDGGNVNAFDAGLGYQSKPDDFGNGVGWFLITNRFIGGGGGGDTTRIYRLRNTVEPNSPVTVNLTLVVDAQDHFKLVAEATGNSKWVNDYAPQGENPERAIITLGGDEEGTIEDNKTLPIQSLPGLAVDGIDNVFSLQIDLATPEFVDPAFGSRVTGIRIYDLYDGYQAPGASPLARSWDVEDTTSATARTAEDRIRRCPSRNWENAYNLNGGNTASGTLSGAFSVDIQIKEPNIHSASVAKSNITEPNHNPVDMAAVVGATTTGTSSFKNLGDDPLSYSLTEGADWLTITSPTSGTLLYGESATVELSATCPNASGTYTAPVTISSNDPDSPTKTITANLTCTSDISVSAFIYSGGWRTSAGGGSGERYQLSANVSGDASNAGYTWSVPAGAGSIDYQNGIWYYVAPLQNPAPSRTVQVRATSNADTAKWAEVSVTVYAIKVNASIYTSAGWTSSGTSMASGQKAEVSASTSWDATNSGVSWSAAAGSFVHENGKTYYVAPLQNPAPYRTLDIVATSNADPGKLDSFPVTVYAITVNGMANCGLGMRDSCSTMSGSTVPMSVAVNWDGTNSGVSWQLSGPGSLANLASTTGDYLAPQLPCDPPGTTSSPVTATVLVTSVADPTKDDPITIYTQAYSCPE